MNKNSAFSLIELAVVLLIVGVLITIVVKGRNLLENAQMKKDYVNYVERLYTDIFKYKAFVFEKQGYEGIIGDAQENGGFEAEPDGFIDTDTDNKTVANKWFALSANASEVRLLIDYNGASRPYDPKDPNHLIAYLKVPEVDPEIDNVFYLGSGTDGFVFTASGGYMKKRVNMYLGADKDGEMVANFLVLYNLPADEARSFDVMIDGEADGVNGKFIVLGFELESPCSASGLSSSTCTCVGNKCVGKGAEGGCPFPECDPSHIKQLVCGYKLIE
jgi:prepilin-type N-terminal cleavage/methylation domain-containing protein